MLEASLDGFSTKDNVDKEGILNQLNLLDFPKYRYVFLSKVYEDENTIDVMLGNQNMARMIWARIIKFLKGESTTTIEDCKKLCESYGVEMKIVDTWLRYGEDNAILRVPGQDDDEKPWILCSNHLGERTPPSKIYMALEILLKNYFKERPSNYTNEGARA